MLYLTITNTFFIQVPRAWRLAFLNVKNKTHDLKPSSRLYANNIDACISVHVCPPLMAVCHKAATASNLTGLTGSHCCLPPNKNRRRRRCRASGEGLQRDSETQAVRQLPLHEREQDLNTQMLSVLLKKKKSYLSFVLQCRSSQRSVILLKVQFKHHQAVAIWTEDIFSLHDSYSSIISD